MDGQIRAERRGEGLPRDGLYLSQWLGTAAGVDRIPITDETCKHCKSGAEKGKSGEDRGKQRGWSLVASKGVNPRRYGARKQGEEIILTPDNQLSLR